MKIFNKALGIILIVNIVLSCDDKPVPPVISTTTATEISTTSAVSGGNITDDGGAPIISKGICWNTTTDPTIANSKTSENGEALSFTSNISQLLPGTSYNARAYATNSAGTGYGKSVSFKTLGEKPVLNSQNVSNIQLTKATLNGTVDPNSLETTITFEYGITASYGSATAAQQSPLSGDSDENVSVDLTGLTPGTTYHFRIKAENSLGITYSSDNTFTTLGSVPVTTALAATSLQYNTAALNGSVNPNYLSTSVIFEWGTTINYGNSITISESPLAGNTLQNVKAEISGLTQGTTYHFRIKATNELGTTTSNDKTFTTLAPITDIEGNVYNIRTIGNQIWMTENLKTTKYSDATPITYGLYYPANDASKVARYGYLYDWAAAINQPPVYDTIMMDLTGQRVQGVCPAGWHLPNVDEWLELVNNYGGVEVAALKLKIADESYWSTPLLIEEPVSGFNAIPAGNRMIDGTYHVCGENASYWTSTQFWTGGGTIMGRQIYMFYFQPTIYINIANTNNQPGSIGLSVRCLRD